MKLLLALLVIPTLALAWSSKPGEYPEIPVGHQPTFPPLGAYSMPDVADAIHDKSAPSVTLGRRERLVDAAARLNEASAGKGGIIYVPWDTDTVQCDNLYFKREQMEKVTISGVLGPTGQLPRFYCLRKKSGGTIPNKEGGVFLQGGATVSTLVENLDVHGYGRIWSMGHAPHVIIRNNYLHGSTADGFTSANIEADDPTTISRVTVFAGNTISHAGQGNGKHCLYIHGSRKQSVLTTLIFIDNDIYSCNWSSAVKSIADVNVIQHNTFDKWKDVNYQPRRYTNMAVDVAACSSSVVRYNTFNWFSPFEEASPGSPIIGVRNRRSIFGCNKPRGWSSEIIKLASGERHQCVRDPLIPECMLPESDFWKDDFWLDKNKEKTLPFIVRENVFNISGYKADKQTILLSEGTYPNFTWTMGGWDCPLPVNPNWYERSMVYMIDNVYNGIQKTAWTYEANPAGWGHPEKCPPPPVVDLRDWNLYTIGEGETFIPPQESK